MSQHPIEAMRQALEAAYLAGFNASGEGYNGEFPFQDRSCSPEDDPQWCQKRGDALRTAIAEAEKQEPVAWLYLDAWGTLKLSQIMPPPTGAFPVYTTPPAAQWVGLTEKDFSAINQSCLTKLQAAISAESILKEKNT
jgi:hypothetical protein